MTVRDIDGLIDRYEVLDERGWTIGEKSREYGYLKPRYTKTGRAVGGKRASIYARFYRSTPPWLKYEVVKIYVCDGVINIRVRQENAE